jgi:hypothetical protein
LSVIDSAEHCGTSGRPTTLRVSGDTRREVMEWTPPASSRVVLLSLHLQVAYPEEESTMKSTVIAVDLAKNIFEIAVSAQPGKIRERKRVSRKTFLSCFGKRQPATVLLEACGSAHHWAGSVATPGAKRRLASAVATGLEGISSTP